MTGIQANWQDKKTIDSLYRIEVLAECATAYDRTLTFRFMRPSVYIDPFQTISIL